MKTISRWLNNPLLIGGALVFFTIWDLLLLGYSSGLNKGEWASWVQAIGSIAAVMIAFYIADNQLQHSRRVEEKRNLDEDLRYAESVRALLICAWTQANSLESAIQNVDTRFIQDFDWKILLDISDALKSIPTLDLPDVTIVISVMPVPSALGAVASIFRMHASTGYRHDHIDYFEWLLAQDLSGKIEALKTFANDAVTACSTYMTHRESV